MKQNESFLPWVLHSYDGQVRKKILALKYAKNLKKAQEVIDQLLSSLEVKRFPQSIDAIVAVPTSYWRRFLRRYDQAELIAAQLAKKLDLPVYSNFIKKSFWSRPQVGLSRESRQQAVKNRFHLNKKIKLQDQHLLLVDDVITTGSTMQEISRCFRGAGAAKVTAFALARSQKS